MRKVSKATKTEGRSLSKSRVDREVVLKLFNLDVPPNTVLQHLDWHDKSGLVRKNRDISRLAFEEILARILENQELSRSMVKEWTNLSERKIHDPEDRTIEHVSLFKELLEAIDPNDREFAAVVSAHLGWQIRCHVVHAIALDTVKKKFPTLTIEFASS